MYTIYTTYTQLTWPEHVPTMSNSVLYIQLKKDFIADKFFLHAPHGPNVELLYQKNIDYVLNRSFLKKIRFVLMKSNAYCYYVCRYCKYI